MEESNVRDIVRAAIQEFTRSEAARQEPAYKAELIDERKRREQLEHRVNQLAQEAQRSQAVAEQAERESIVRAELQRLGVAKVDLAFKAVKDDISRGEDGRLVGKGDQGEMPAKEYLKQFVAENPELLPSRIAGGSGATPQIPLRSTWPSAVRGVAFAAWAAAMPPASNSMAVVAKHSLRMPRSYCFAASSPSQSSTLWPSAKVMRRMKPKFEPSLA